MKKSISLLLTLVALLLSPVALTAGGQESEQKSVDAAKKAAASWLALTDASKYSESWDAAASLFKSSLSRDKWEASMTQARTPLGKVQSRDLKRAAVKADLPGAPAGAKFVQVIYLTKFEHAPGPADESIMMMLEGDEWRGVGYFITPAK